MGRNLDQFEESIRSSVEHFSFPYDQSSWKEMEARLDDVGSAGNQYGSLLVAAGFLLLSGLFFVISPQNRTTASLPTTNNLIETGWAETYSTSDALEIQTSSETPTDTFAEEGSDESPSSTLAIAANQSTHITDNSPKVSSTESSDAITSIEGPLAEAGLEDAGGDGSDGDQTTAEMDRAPVAAPVAIALSRQEVCAGEEIAFSVNLELEGMSYLWIMGDGKFYPDVPNPTHVYDEPGEWNISLSILDAKGKITASKLQAQVIVHATPDAEFSWEFTNDPGELPTVQFMNTSEHASECTWVFGGSDSSSDINPERSYLKRGKKKVMLTAVNEFGCTDDTYRNIYIEKDYNLEAPLSLSTSSGMSFMPDALVEEKREFKLSIYDEKQPIFSTQNAEKGWDGSLPSGAKVQAGESYPWVVIIYNRYGEEQEYYSGEINITP